MWGHFILSKASGIAVALFQIILWIVAQADTEDGPKKTLRPCLLFGLCFCLLYGRFTGMLPSLLLMPLHNTWFRCKFYRGGP